MTNPFEDQDRDYLVLLNGEDQHSLWPADLEVPAGWTITHDRDAREACLEYVESHWNDIRPASLRQQMRRH